MALALYRKYRPRTFAEVIGQEHVTEPLSRALRSGRLHHAYLFSGPRGCGKTSSARILARSLNCAEGPTPEPCGRCESCVSLANDGAGSIDVIEIDAASHGGVDDARELRERAFFAPVSSRYKIYVIDEAHMVSSAGFNALLKLVEEPPDYVKFIFATTEPEKVLGTIKSRTHHYPFRLIPPGVLRPYLEQLCQEEGVAVEPAVFPLVVRAGGGSARDTLSVLDQLIAGAGEGGVSYARAVALLGVTDAALIDEMCDALAAGDGAATFTTVDRVSEAGHDPRRFASDLLERLRDLIVLRQVPDAADKGLLDAPVDQLARMQSQAQRMGPAMLSRCADIVHNGLVEMRGTTAPRLLLELICARMLLPGADDSTGGLLQRVERMERRLTLSGDLAPTAGAGSAPGPADPGVRPAPAPGAAGPSPRPVPLAADSARPGPGPAPSSPAPSGPVPSSPVPSGPPLAGPPQRPDPAGSGPAPRTDPAGSGPASPGPAGSASVSARPVASGPAAAEPGPARSGSAAPPAGGGDVPPGPAPLGQLDVTAVRQAWNQVLALVNDRKKVVAAWAREATVQDLDGETVVLLFQYPFHAQKLSAQHEALVEALVEVLGGRWQIRCEVAGEQLPPGDARQAPAVAQPPAGAAGGRGPGGAGVAPPGGSAAGGGSRPAPPGSVSAATAPSDVDWPETAQPGGATGPTASATAPAASAPVASAPVASVPAASVPAASAPATPGSSAVAGTPEAGSTSGPAAGPSRPVGRPGDRTPGNGTVGSAAGNGTTGNLPGNGTTGGAAGRIVAGGAAGAARQAARDAASGRGGGSASRTGAPRAGAGRATGGTSDGRRRDEGASGAESWPADPPYDPEYDGPVRATAGYEGFDPGDEPLDEVIDERTARQTSEQQALQVARQVLGAEKIGEVDVR